MPDRRRSGNTGEDAVCAFLERNGYVILCRNYTVRGGEIDIIAEKDGVIAFVEVKLRKEGALVTGEEAVNRSKRKHLIYAAERYMLGAGEGKCGRFDVAAVEVKKDGRMSLKYYVSAFDASK